MAPKDRFFLPYVISLIVALSTCVIVTHKARQIALSNEENVYTFFSFTESLEHYKLEIQ